MTHTSYYIAIKSSLHSSDSSVFGLSHEEINALSNKYGGSHIVVINGVIIKAPPVQLINSLSELGYKVICCSGDSELTWTMMSGCEHSCQNSSVCQSLDELEFERGIWFAAQNNDILRVKQLIEKRNDPNVKDKSGYTALHYASRNGHLELCKFLVSKGADVNVLTRSGKVSPLHRCASMGHLEIFKLLLQAGATMNNKDSDGKTVLHRAVEGGNGYIVKEILTRNPNLKFVSDSKGKVPRDYASNSEILHLLE